MRIKLRYILTLLILLSAWGMFRAVAASRGREVLIQSKALSANGNASDPQTVTNPPLIPVTGHTPPGRVLLAYSLIGLGALVLILALLSLANRSTTLSIKPKRLSDKTEGD